MHIGGIICIISWFLFSFLLALIFFFDSPSCMYSSHVLMTDVTYCHDLFTFSVPIPFICIELWLRLCQCILNILSIFKYTSTKFSGFQLFSLPMDPQDLALKSKVAWNNLRRTFVEGQVDV